MNILGKMEMFSKKFAPTIQDVFKKEACIILATMPNKVTHGPLSTLLESLKKDAEIVQVTKANRNNLVESILAKLNL